MAVVIYHPSQGSSESGRKRGSNGAAQVHGEEGELGSKVCLSRVGGFTYSALWCWGDSSAVRGTHCSPGSLSPSQATHNCLTPAQAMSVGSVFSRTYLHT